MKIGSKDYFVCANTACGFVNYFDSNLEHLQQLFVLKGASGCGKSTMMRQLGRLCQKWGYRTEYIHCSSDPQSLDGVIMPELQTAIVDGTAPHVLEPFLAGVTGEYVNLGMAIQPEKLKACRYEMITLKKEIKALLHRKPFRKALPYHLQEPFLTVRQCITTYLLLPSVWPLPHISTAMFLFFWKCRPESDTPRFPSPC